MMKKFVKAEDEPEITHRYSLFCGGITDIGYKVILLYVGVGERLHAICNREAAEINTPNISWGDTSVTFADTEDFVKNSNKYVTGEKITDFYMFDSLKEMLKWFAE